MNALNAPFGFTITSGGRSLSLREGCHFRMYPTGKDWRFGEELSKRQIDLLRIGMAIHAADRLVPRHRSKNGRRQPIIDIEVLDVAFWSRSDSYDRLKQCVDFLSGSDDWSFRFRQAAHVRHESYEKLFRGHDRSALVALYSGGLDSAAGLAARLAEIPGGMVVPVTVRHQTQKGKLVRDHFKLLVDAGLSSNADLQPFQAGVFIRNRRIKEDLGVRLREDSHRCRPFLYMSVAGMVADSVSSPEVEIFESGVGSVNVPLVSGPADYRTTCSSHPRFLRLFSDLASHVNEAEVRFVLPFDHMTKAEVVGRAKAIGMEELTRKSVSCILHPLRRGNGRQCGHCTACVYRRQAMITAGIDEGPDAYDVDLFSPAGPPPCPPEKQLEPIRAFHQQAGRLAELETGRVPECFRRYLYTTQAVSTENELGLYAKVHRRYWREWDAIIANARRRCFPWIGFDRSPAYAQGGNR